MIHWYILFPCSLFISASTGTILSNFCDNPCDNPFDRTAIISVNREDAADSPVHIFSLIQAKCEQKKTSHVKFKPLNSQIIQHHQGSILLL